MRTKRMNRTLKRSLALAIGLVAAWQISACGGGSAGPADPDPNRPAEDTSGSGSGQNRPGETGGGAVAGTDGGAVAGTDGGAGTDDTWQGEVPIEPEALRDVWLDTPFDSPTDTVDCASLGSAELLQTTLSPGRIATLTFDCAIDAQATTVTLGGAAVTPVQLSRVAIGFLTPDVGVGNKALRIVSGAESIDLEVETVASPTLPANPAAYITETIEVLRAGVDAIGDPAYRAWVLGLHAQAEASLADMTAAQAREATALLIANEEALGLSPMINCQYDPPEDWFPCARRDYAVHLTGALASAGIVAVSLQTIATPPQPFSLIGLFAGAVGIGLSLGNLNDNSIGFVTFVIDRLQIQVDMTTNVRSGQPFRLSLDGEYLSQSGVSPSATAPLLSKFLSAIRSAIAFIQRVNQVARTSFSYDALVAAPRQEILPVDPRFWSVRLDSAVSPSVTATLDGRDITLVSTDAEPAPARLVVRYDYPGVATVEETVDVVVDPYEGPVAPEGFAAIPAGTFIMGMAAGEFGDYEGLQHTVNLTRGFLLGVTEVTQGQWKARSGGVNPSEFSACGDNCPVERVTWWSTLGYLNALSAQDGLPSCFTLPSSCTGTWQAGTLDCSASSPLLNAATIYDCTGYRLPTDAEWEYAGRAGTTTPTYGGHLVDAEGCATLSGSDRFPMGTPLAELAWYECNSQDHTHPVGLTAANAWGLKDMLGNVEEWVFDPGTFGETEVRTDPVNPVEVPLTRGFRGGSFRQAAMWFHIGSSGGLSPHARHPINGFRVARTLPAQPSP